ncbi:hypothetical protein [Myroides profundi]|uniref:Uncharacterized protein n=1 Tax=Myroides profundi TaxID=480520 RepID=A0AAJ5BEE8_MYRPR|nr:hypothetical protein [Myroides profundi]AJH15473.1 hypothetical protein MPR_2302 [Myroides profundi]SER09631.1 hypothetical protein SAMN04488089_10990 [Myroides profundi]
MEEVKEPFVFKGYQYEDLDYAIENFVNEYNLSLDPQKLAEVRNVAEMLDLIVSYFKQEKKEDCTSQQAFYKLRTILHKYTNESDIKPNTRLEELFPKQNRIENIKRVEEDLGFKLKVFKPKEYKVLMLWLFFFVLVIFAFFQQFLLVTLGIVVLYFLRGIIFENGEEFKVETVGELVKLMVEKNYFKSRRDPDTMNEQELREMIAKYFADCLGLEREEFLNAKFG